MIIVFVNVYYDCYFLLLTRMFSLANLKCWLRIFH